MRQKKTESNSHSSGKIAEDNPSPSPELPIPAAGALLCRAFGGNPGRLAIVNFH